MCDSNRNIAYRRVSTKDKDQDTGRQLFECGISFDLEFEDKQSGTNADNRVELQKCLGTLLKGDTLHVHSIDRICRNTRQLLNIVSDLTDRKVNIKFHKEGLFFGGDLEPMQKAMQDVLLANMGALHQFQATMIQESVKDGLRRAKARGVKLGGYRPTTKERNNNKEMLAKQQAEPYRELMSSLAKERLTLKQMSDKLNMFGKKTPTGGKFYPTSVNKMLERLEIRR